MSLKSKVHVVIPARFASTRLPQKMLMNETGKPLIQYAYQAALQAKLPEGVTIATDHDEIYNAVQQFGGKVVMTNASATSGTDRVAEVAARMPEVDIFVNVQGDEPEMAPESIDLLIQLLIDHPDAEMATLCTPICDKNQLDNPACVKVVRDKNQRALYFSRSIIPYPRNWSEQLLVANPPVYYLHLGLYAYRRDFLLKMSSLPPSPFETIESLEQLRVLYNGYTILCGVTPHTSCGIDTPEDYAAFVQRQQAK